MNPLILTGFAHSVYTRAVRLALYEKGLEFTDNEVNPFEPEDLDALRPLHPFGRVPVLQHGDTKVYETVAILAYLDEMCGGISLTPDAPLARVRMVQVQGIVDNYVYQPLVRKVFSHGVYRPQMGQEADSQAVSDGLDAAPAVLDALEDIASEGFVLQGKSVTRADCHLAPMLDYFALYPAGKQMLDARPALLAWFDRFASRPSFAATRPSFVSELDPIP